MKRRVRPDTGELAPLRSWLHECLGVELTKQQRQLFVVAVTEAVTNAIEAHLRHEVERPIDVTIDREARVVIVADHGGGIADTDSIEHLAERGSVPPPSARRGRGLLIIQSICPGTRFMETESGSRIELTFPT